MKSQFKIIILLFTFIFCHNNHLFSQGYGEDSNTIDFLFDSGHTFSHKPSFCQRLSGVKNILLLEPTQKSQYDNFLYGNLAIYFRQLGLNVKVKPTSDYTKTSTFAYGSPIVWCNFDGYTVDHCEQANSLIVGLSYGTSPNVKDKVSIWISDIPNNFYWEFHLDGLPNKGAKLVEKFKKILCSSYTYNTDWEYRPPHIESTLTEQKLKDEYYNGKPVSIYQGDNYRLVLYKTDKDDLFLIYLGGKERNIDWKIGDIKAWLEKTSTPGVYLATWWGKWKQKMDYRIIIKDGLLTTYDENKKEEIYIQIFPTSNDNNDNIKGNSGNDWSGTGFALKDGYIVTNYHVIEDAKSITIHGVNGNFNISYSATVIGSDKNNDLALLKINDPSFNGFGSIPYSITTTTTEVGEDIFVLGYPLTSTMGDEIKLTNGIISSKTGFQGDVSLYQISAPIQPGNSGGPLFDKKGNVIGVVSAKHAGAENVGYAIKSSYLRNLIESCASSSIIPSTNTISTLSLPEKVKKERNFVFFIHCSLESSKFNNNLRSLNNTNSRIINNPSFNSKSEGNITINSVTITPTETILDCSSKNPLYGGWMNINPKTYLRTGGKEYKLTKTEGIKYAPDYTYFDFPNQTLNFKLYFQPIPINSVSMDFMESLTSGWRIYGISLQ